MKIIQRSASPLKKKIVFSFDSLRFIKSFGMNVPELNFFWKFFPFCLEIVQYLNIIFSQVTHIIIKRRRSEGTHQKGWR